MTLRTLRKTAGFRTQQDLADDLGVHLTTVNRWETGELPVPKWLPVYLRMKIELNGNSRGLTIPGHSEPR